MKEIKLGDKVRCKITGFTGIAVAKSEFINGCVQWTVVPRVKNARQTTMPEEIGIDSQSLEIINKPKKKVKKEKTGGAMTRQNIRRNF